MQCSAADVSAPRLCAPNAAALHSQPFSGGWTHHLQYCLSWLQYTQINHLQQMQWTWPMSRDRSCTYFLHPYNLHASVAHFACRIIVKFCRPGWVWRRWLHDAVIWSCCAVRDGEMASVRCIWRPAKQWDLERRHQLAWVFCASKHKAVAYIKFWFEALNNIQWSKTWSRIRHPMQIPDMTKHIL